MVSAADDIDPSAEESAVEPLDGPLSLVSYIEQIHKTEVKEENPFGSIWHMNAASYKTCVTFIEFAIDPDYMLVGQPFWHLKPSGIGICDCPSLCVCLAVKVSDYMYQLIVFLLIFLPGWAFVCS